MAPRCRHSRGLPRLVDHLKARLVVVRVREIGPLIASGAVRVHGRVAAIADPVDVDDVIAIDPDALAQVALVPEPAAATIRYEDDALVICDKPAGMHVHPIGAHRCGTLLNELLWHCGARPDRPWGQWRPSPAHRLDRAASGLVAFAKRASIHDAMTRQFAAHAVERTYRAVVRGRVADDVGIIDAPLARDPALDYRRAVVSIERGGQRAVTRFTVVARSAHETVLDVSLETGRTHQIRAHMASIGHALVGDSLYAPGAARTDATDTIALHATALRFRHPLTGVALACTSPAPADLAARCRPSAQSHS